MEDEQYVSPYKIKKRFDITSNTLKTWGEQGDIKFIRIIVKFNNFRIVIM